MSSNGLATIYMRAEAAPKVVIWNVSSRLHAAPMLYAVLVFNILHPGRFVVDPDAVWLDRAAEGRMNGRQRAGRLRQMATGWMQRMCKE